jgi:hypothetical protein
MGGSNICLFFKGRSEYGYSPLLLFLNSPAYFNPTFYILMPGNTDILAKTSLSLSLEARSGITVVINTSLRNLSSQVQFLLSKIFGGGGWYNG